MSPLLPPSKAKLKKIPIKNPPAPTPLLVRVQGLRKVGEGLYYHAINYKRSVVISNQDSAYPCTFLFINHIAGRNPLTCHALLQGLSKLIRSNTSNKRCGTRAPACFEIPLSNSNSVLCCTPGTTRNLIFLW